MTDHFNALDPTPDKPIQVPASAMPQIVATIVRYLLTALGGWLLSRGIVSEEARDALLGSDVVDFIVGAILTLGPIVVGALRTKRNVAAQQIMEPHVPNSVARLSS